MQLKVTKSKTLLFFRAHLLSNSNHVKMVVFTKNSTDKRGQSSFGAINY